MSDKQYEGYDFFLIHNGMKFSTPDRDNDKSSGSCAVIGGFWFNGCYRMHLTDIPKPQLHNGERYLPYDYAETSAS